MKSQHDFVIDILSLVTAAGIPYMITGSLASTYYGRPRTTQDIDLVIEADANRLSAFVAAVQKRGYYVDANDAAEALSRRSIFNIIDADSGYKLDLIVRKDREFSRQEFGRRREVTLLGGRAFMVSPEDSILSKLEWSREGASERQFLDALAVARTQGDDLDLAYLKRWAQELGLTAELERLLSEAKRRKEP
ncbi:MAG: hypothetical protein NT005_09930 [Spirochaetes bacterium]|nr:hypothetical protein [Spirochaetota bacterium]